MTIIALIITALLEQQGLLNRVRIFFSTRLLKYVRFFLNKDFKSQRQIRYAYFIACVPVVILLLLIHILLYRYLLIHFIFKIIVFILCIQVLTWKEEAKATTQHNKSFNFINTFATRFFAPLFWFMILPCGIGSICYLIVTSMSQELKNKGLDLVVYNVVVDKMLFYVNVIPYLLLYILIAFAGDFENVSHYFIGQRKNFTKGFYFLDSMLHDSILIAIDTEKYRANAADVDGEAEAGFVKQERFSVQMTKYIVAVLYRAGLFFIGIVAVAAIAHMFGFIA